MAKRSAGLLLYRRRNSGLEIFLVHPGGPFWAKKDLGAWSIPKGEYLEGEDPLEVAKREFQEETGFAPPGAFWELGELKQAGGKIVSVWASEGDCAIPGSSPVIHSRWSGRRARVDISKCRKWTAVLGARSRTRGCVYWLGNEPF